MKNIAIRSRAITAICAPAVAGLLLLTGCSHPSNHPASPTPSTTTASASTASANMTGAVTATPAANTNNPAATGAAKADFCREVNTAINVLESPGTTLDAQQGETVTTALENASQSAIDIPTGTTAIINAMLADLQAPTTTLPPSFATNQDKLAQNAASYCG